MPQPSNSADREAIETSIDTLRQWIGRSRVETDTVTETPARLLAATLNRPKPPGPGEMLPYLWHWLYFLSAARTGDLGKDGHQARGDFMPPVTLPRRMWAGSRLEFRSPIKIGESITRRTIISDVVEKIGRSGRLIFVRVNSEIECPRGLAVVEERDIVFREAQLPVTAEPKQAPGEPEWRMRVVADSALLFRYSALTFNSHRIHYDWRYATEIEGYRNLVVTGPLVATLLVELAATRLPSRAIGQLFLRSVSPLFADEPVEIAGRRSDEILELWAANPQNELSMTARAELL